MTRGWPLGVAVAMLLLAPSPSAAQDDGGEWEGRIEYTAHIGITSLERQRREKTSSSANSIRTVDASSHERDRHIDGKLTVSIWMSKGRTTVVVTGHSSWSREDDTQRTDANGNTTCDGEQLVLFSDTAFRDDDAGASVSLDDANRFTISSNGTGRADAWAGIYDHDGHCANFGHRTIPHESKRLDQPWSVALSGVSKSRNAITLKYSTDPIPYRADGKSAAPWFYEVFDQFVPPLTERLSGSGISAFTYEEVNVDLRRGKSDGFWTGTFSANCQDSGTKSGSMPSGGSLEGTQSYSSTTTEKQSVEIVLPADGGAPTAQVAYHSTLRSTNSVRARIKCGVLGWQNTDPNWKPYNSDEETRTTVDASGKATPTVKVDRLTKDDRRTGVSIDMKISVPPVEGRQNTFHNESFNGGCGGEPTGKNSDVDDDALSPSFYWFRGVNNATQDTVSGSYTDKWEKRDKFAVSHNATCTYSWRFKYVKQEPGR